MDAHRRRELAFGLGAYAAAVAGVATLLISGVTGWVTLPVALVTWLGLDIFAAPLVRPRRTPAPPPRGTGAFMVTITEWGPRAIDVLKESRAEDAGVRTFETLSEAMHRRERLIVRTGLSRAAARDIADVLERAGATVVVESSHTPAPG